MTIETLKSLINHAFEREGFTPQLRDSVNKYLDLYERELNTNKPSTLGHRQLLVEQPNIHFPNPMNPYCSDGTGNPILQMPSTTSDTTISRRDLNVNYTSK